MLQPGPHIRNFMRVAPPILREHFRDDSCLNASRVLVEVLGHFGLIAKPMSVNVIFLNAPYFARLSKFYAERLGRFISGTGARVVRWEEVPLTDEELAAEAEDERAFRAWLRGA